MLGAFLGLTPPATAGTDGRRVEWPQFGFDPGRSSHNDQEDELGAGNVAGLTEQWSALYFVLAQSDLVVADGALYFTAAFQSSENIDDLVALNARDGHRLWRAKACGTPVVVRRLLVAWSKDQNGLVAYDSRTGAQVWRAAVGHGDDCQAPAVVDGDVYVAATESVHAFDAETGHQLWESASLGSVVAPVAVEGGTVYVKTEGRLQALDATTGMERWSVETVHGYHGSLAVVPETVAAVSNAASSATLATFDATTGAEGWSAEVPNNDYNGQSPAIADGMIYVNGGSGSRDCTADLVAFDLSSGVEVWSQSEPMPPGDIICPVMGKPTIANGVVYAGFDTSPGFHYYVEWRAFDAATGDILWSAGYDWSDDGENSLVTNGTLFTNASGLVQAWGHP